MTTWLVVYVLLSIAVSVSECGFLREDVFNELVDLFVELKLIADVPATRADWEQMEAVNVTDMPTCPGVTRYFTCASDGTLDVLNVTLPTTIGHNATPIALRWSRAYAVRVMVIENFIGNFGGLRVLAARESIDVRNSLFAGIWVNPNDTSFMFQAPSVTLTNVSLVHMDFPANLTAMFDTCRFVNVTVRCPVPQALWSCFGNASLPLPCLDIVPPEPSPWKAQRCSSYACQWQCSSPPAAGFDCPERNYFPSVVGLNVIELAFKFIGQAEALDLYTLGTIGLINRVELWDWATFNWTVVYDIIPMRRIDKIGSESDERINLPPILTNRVRFAVEQYYQPRDVISRIYLMRSAWPKRAMPRRIGQAGCGSALSLGARSMRDETVGDSLCVGKVCQFACTIGVANFTFDRVVLARYLVLLGGDEWVGGTLESSMSLSDGTRVYRLDGAATRTVNVTGVGDVRRARLVGDPLLGETLPTVANPTRLGLPGIFVKSARTRVAPGATLARTAASEFAGKSVAPPFALNSATTIATVMNSTFALANDRQMWRFDSGGSAWRKVENVELSRIKLNLNDSEPVRSLVAVGTSLLVVVAANSQLHDGSSDQLLINRWVVQTPIDVFDAASNTWFVGLMQHDVAKNISDIDVVSWNSTHFAVVDRATEAASLFQFNAFSYALKQCTANTNCNSCLVDEANIEPCRWCSSRCASFCALNETAIINVSQCAIAETESTTSSAETGEMQSRTVVASVATTPLTAVSSEALADSGLSSSATIGLAVGLPLVLLALVGVGAAFLWWRTKRPAVESTSSHLSDLHSANNAKNPYDDIHDVRSTQGSND
jgi:hypothetical protein